MLSNSSPSSTLQTLVDFIAVLHQEETKDYHHFIRKIKLQPQDFEKYTSWSTDCYTRNCIANNDKFELILICWCEGQKTPIHDHGGEECWVKVIEGELEEVIYKMDDMKKLKKVNSSISTSNQVTYMKDFMGFHSLENKADKRSMTLHLYAKPIRKCNIYNEDKDTFIETELSYHTQYQNY